MLVSHRYRIFRAEDFSVIQMGEQEKMWLLSSEPKLNPPDSKSAFP